MWPSIPAFHFPFDYAPWTSPANYHHACKQESECSGKVEKLMGVNTFRPLFPGNPDHLPLFQEQLKKQHVKPEYHSSTFLYRPLAQVQPWAHGFLFVSGIRHKCHQRRLEFHGSSQWWAIMGQEPLVPAPPKSFKAPLRVDPIHNICNARRRCWALHLRWHPW